MKRFNYRIGARVKILIGHPIWGTDSIAKGKERKLIVTDMRHDLVGKSATVKHRMIAQGLQRYGLEIDDVGYIAWFSCKQIERI